MRKVVILKTGMLASIVLSVSFRTWRWRWGIK